MSRRRLLIAVGVIVVLIIGYFAFQTFLIASSGQQTEEFFSQTSLTQCEQTKRRVCNEQGSIGEVDYPDSCFRDGEHILDTPYTCPE